MNIMMRKMALLLMIGLLLVPACDPVTPAPVACSAAALIAAITHANTTAAPDVLELEPGCVYTLTEVHTTLLATDHGSTFDYGDVGLPPVTTPITINGNNATITRADDAPAFRIFHLARTGQLTLNDLTITNGWARREGSAFPSSGGAIYNDGAPLTINRSSLQFNRAEYNGGAVFDVGASTTRITDSMISENSAPVGGGIFEYETTLLSVEGSSIVYNSAEGDGGGIGVGYGSELVVKKSVISFNHSAWRGGGIFKDGGYYRRPTTVSGSTFEGNIAGWGGGAILIWRTPLSIASSQFLQNRASEYGGGLAYENTSSETVLIRSTTFDGNTAGLDGGAIHFSGELMALDYDTFRNNTARNGGAIHNAAAELDWYIKRADTTMNIGNCTIENNTAGADGGGTFNGSGAALTIDESAVVGNKSASRGGGIHNLGGITVQDSAFRRNSAGLEGGGLNTSGKAVLTGSTFEANSAMQGGGLASVGGDTRLSNDTFSKNSAADMGGGIFNTGPASGDPKPGGGMQVSHVTVAFNSASGGGGIAARGGLLKVKSSIVALNTSGGDCYSGGADLLGVSENLDADDTCPGFTLMNDPLLEALADNGGPTQTHALKPDSPAVDAAPDCTTVGGAAVSNDQRGQVRPAGAFCDLGAYEYQQVFEAPEPKQPMVTVTAEPPTLTAIQNANCRYGPGTAYDIADTLMAGETAAIVGRNEQNTWWQIKGPAFGTLCWVSSVTVKVSGSTEGVPVGVAPPPPTLTPEPHRPQNKPQGCWVYNQRQVPVCTVPCPPNAKPGGACTP